MLDLAHRTLFVQRNISTHVDVISSNEVGRESKYRDHSEDSQEEGTIGRRIHEWDSVRGQGGGHQAVRFPGCCPQMVIHHLSPPRRLLRHIEDSAGFTTCLERISHDGIGCAVRNCEDHRLLVVFDAAALSFRGSSRALTREFERGDVRIPVQRRLTSELGNPRFFG